ncbi:MAG: PTS transporter subunit EIIC [Ligilactobacillus salivarius]|nr:PTS transporter subunit EIIC [Ligilactobacillus salivarius]
MKKFMDWLQYSFSPKANKLFARPWISAVSSSFQVIIPFILTGSLIYAYKVLVAYIPSLPNLDYVEFFTFRMMGLLIAYAVADQVMEKTNTPQYKTVAALSALIFDIALSYPSLAEGNWVISQSRLGPTGVLLGMISGIFVSMIFRLVAMLHILEDNVSIPTFVVNWITNIIPIFIVFLSAQIFVFELKIDIWPILMSVFSPIQNFAESLPGFVLLIFLPCFFYSLGISPWVWNSVRSPIYSILMEANIVAVASGMVATNVTTSEVQVTSSLLQLGGTGCTLALVILMCFSKAKSIKTLGRVCILPSIFNINEPVVYGAPMAFNPLLMIPMWICGLVCPTLLWIILKVGILPIPALNIRVGQIPAPLSTYVVFGTFSAIAVWALFMVLTLAIYYPFFKTWEKKVMEESVNNLNVKE